MTRHPVRTELGQTVHSTSAGVQVNTLKKVRNLKPLILFVFFFTLACKTSFIETHSIKRYVLRTGKSTVHRRVHVPFGPEMLQAGAAEGLNAHGWM